MTWPSLSSAKLWCVPTLVAVLMLWLSPPAHCQNTLNVPADYLTIQSAINAASNGDTVLVTPGTYVENINFSGKAITLTSSNGAAATIIDGNHNGSVVTFNHSETPSSILTGFTIRNGYLDGGEGAGILISAASPTITNNVITGNHAADGIGIYVNGGAPLIKSNTITANDQEDAGDGGGGGGILVAGSENMPASPQIISNTITNNSVANGGDGGGIAVQYYASPLIQRNLIRGNIAFNDGGGISLQTYFSAVVSDNLIVNNRSLGGGSGAGIWISAAGLAQTTVSNIVNNTIVGNTAFDSTSGIYSTGYGQYVKISNNIVVASTGQTGVTCSSLFSPILPDLTHNDVHSDTVGWSGCGTPAIGGAGNIDLDPLFIDPSTNFHLQSGSPVLDAGDNSAPGLPSTDFDGGLRVVDGNADGIAVADMGAYELQPTTITWTPDSLTFNPQPLRTTSPPQTLTLTNTGAQTLYLVLAASGPFAQTDNCAGTVPAGANCSISVTFAPASTGILTGAITLRDNAPQSPQTIQLSGTGGVSSVTLTPSSLSFDGQVVGSTSPAQTVNLANSGDGPLTISSITANGDFSQTSNCGGSLAAGSSCSINVAFAPTVGGTRQGTLTVTGNIPDSPLTVSLTGTGLVPQAVLSPTTLSFGGQAVGTSSASQAVILSNTGGAPLTISSIAVTGDYSQTNSCATTLAPGANCSITVSFAPIGFGSRNGTLTVTDNASGSPQAVSLTGIGLVPMTYFSPDILTFAGQAVGTTSASQTVTFSNTGGAPATISRIVVTGGADYAQTNTCGITLAAGASCSVTVTFTPTAAGTRIAYVTVTSNARNSPSYLGLQGTGLAPQAALSPASLSFIGQAVGTTGASQTVTLSNSGNASLTISSIAISGDFSRGTSCGSTLAAGATCSIAVTFTPTAGGTRQGTLTLTDNSSGSPQTVSLTGTGLVPQAALSPISLTFGGQAVGTPSPSQTVTLSNAGGAPLTISSISSTADFSQTSNCGGSLAASASCSISITFLPMAGGTRQGTLTVTDNASGSAQTVSLVGTGLVPQVAFSPASLSFGGQAVGTTSASQTLTLSNTGGASLAISGISISGDFSQSSSCGSSLAAGSSCSLNVTFTPAAAGTRQGVLTLTDNAAGSPQTVSLSGTGLVPQVVLSPTALSFGGQSVGTTSSSQTVTLSNAGGAPLTVSNIASIGDFSQANSCSTVLAAGASCSITVTFRPTVAGTRQGTLAVTDNASGSPQDVSLSGTGLGPLAVLSPTSLSFGNQVVGTPSASQTVTLSNTSGASLTVSGIATSGDFSQSSSCGSTLAAGASCAINITFVPSTAGARTGTLTVSSNSSGGPVTTSLSGSGIQNAPTFDSTSLVFSNQNVGTTSGGKNVKLNASGPGPLTISSISVTGPFLQSNNCPALLNAGSSCNITVNFSPTVGGLASGAILISDNGMGSPQAVSLSGNGLDFMLSVSPPSAAVNAGQNAKVLITASQVGGNFNNSVNLTCSGLPGAAKCQFSPAGISPKTGSATSNLTVQTVSSTPSGTYTISITGASGAITHNTTLTLTVN